MLRNPSQVWLFGTNKARRWLCTVMATESTPIMSGSRSRIRVTGSKESSTLYHKLTALDSSNGSVVQFLDDWVLKQRKFLHRYDILGFIDEFRKYKQFNHALQLLDWMEMRGMRLSFGEHAKRIDLLWRTGGIVAAEKYFTDLPIPAKNVFTYGTLLNCFCNEKMTEKAMALLEEMKKLKMELNSFLYSSLMVLHMKLGEPEKVQALAEDMKEKNIAPHIFTYNLLMSSYASLNDIEGVERVFKEVEGGSKVMPEWDFYCNLAGIYVGAGLFEKADSILKEVERRKMLRNRVAFRYLLSLYAKMGNAAEVNRIWESLKSSFPKTTNLSYLVMLQALSILNDLDSLKKCFDEWELECSYYDIKLVNALLTAYLKRDMIEEGKLLLEHVVKKGSKPNFTTYGLFVDFYVKNRSVDFALKCMEVASSYVEEKELSRYREKAHMFLKYFEKEKDVDAAEDFYMILKQANCLDQDVYGLLLRVYIAAGRTNPQMRQRMKADAIEINSETETLLEYVCPD